MTVLHRLKNIMYHKSRRDLISYRDIFLTFKKNVAKWGTHLRLIGDNAPKYAGVQALAF